MSEARLPEGRPQANTAEDASAVQESGEELSHLLSAHGLRKKSLSSSGALTALIVGFLAMTGGTRVFGVMLIGFYLVGSRATKCEYGATPV